jgi:hypothetical protein
MISPLAKMFFLTRWQRFGNSSLTGLLYRPFRRDGAAESDSHSQHDQDCRHLSTKPLTGMPSLSDIRGSMASARVHTFPAGMSVSERCCDGFFLQIVIVVFDPLVVGYGQFNGITSSQLSNCHTNRMHHILSMVIDLAVHDKLHTDTRLHPLKPSCLPLELPRSLPYEKQTKLQLRGLQLNQTQFPNLLRAKWQRKSENQKHSLAQPIQSRTRYLHVMSSSGSISSKQRNSHSHHSPIVSYHPVHELVPCPTEIHPA